MKKSILYLTAIFSLYFLNVYAQDETIKGKIETIYASSSGKDSFYFAVENQQHIWLKSTMLEVQSAMLSAFLTGTQVEVDLVRDTDDQIYRVKNIYKESNLWRIMYNGFSITRISTQHNAQTGNDKLEAFIKLESDSYETPFNIFDPFFEHLILLSFSAYDGTFASQPRIINMSLEFREENGVKDIDQIKLTYVNRSVSRK